MKGALATVVSVLVKPGRGRPASEVLRRALRSYVLPVPRRERERPEEIAAAVRWIERASLSVAELQEVARAHEVVDTLSRRAVIFNALEYAVELEHLRSNPLSRVRRKRGKRAVQEVDSRVVVDPRQAREWLTALTYVGGYDRASGRRLRAFFGCCTTRPWGQGKRSAFAAPTARSGTGLGPYLLAETRPTAGKAWTDFGEAHDRRGLKQRAHGEVRIVPIPPPLVRLLREHLKEFGRPAVLQRAGQRDRGLVVLTGVEAGSGAGARSRSGGPGPGLLAVRPPPRGRLPAAQLRRARPGDRRSRGPLGGCSAEDLRQVHRRPGAGDERPDHARARGGGRNGAVKRFERPSHVSPGESGAFVCNPRCRSSLTAQRPTLCAPQVLEEVGSCHRSLTLC